MDYGWQQRHFGRVLPRARVPDFSNVDLTAGTLTATATNTLIMDGTTKTLTQNSQTLQNVTLSGTITMATGHPVNGNLTLSGTITCTGLQRTMTGNANDLIGGGNTLAD